MIIKFNKKQCVAALKKTEGSARAAARLLCVDHSTVNKAISEFDIDVSVFKPEQESIQSRIDTYADNRKRKDDSKQLKQAIAEIERLNKTIDHITGIPELVNTYKMKPEGIKSYGKDASVMFAALSDIHAEQRIDRSKTLGRAEHTPKSVTKKLHRYYSQLPELARDISRRTSVKSRLVHPMLGDMINGSLHNDITGSNWMTPQEAVEFLLPILCSGIKYLLDSQQWDRILIPCCVGNHARSTPKPETEMRVETSYEWPLYLRMRDHFRDIGEDRVTVVVPTEYFTRITLPNDDSILCHHGDAVKYSNGVGGLLIPLQKYVNNTNSHPEVMGSMVKKLNLNPPLLHLVGHFHTYVHSPGIIANGAMVPAGGYAHSKGMPFQTCKQAVFVLHPEHGLTYMTPIVFED